MTAPDNHDGRLWPLRLVKWYFIGAPAQAKEAGLSDATVQEALAKVNWQEGDGIA